MTLSSRPDTEGQAFKGPLWCDVCRAGFGSARWREERMSYPNQPNERPTQREVPQSGQPAGWPPQQPSGSPPAYGTPPRPSYARVRRPWTLIRALGAAFVLELICLTLGGFTLGYIFTGDFERGPFIGFIVAATALVFAVLCAWGAVAAWRGRTSHILFWTSVAVLIIGIVVLILRSPRGWFPLLLCPIWIISFLLTPSSREFFRGRGGTTI